MAQTYTLSDTLLGAANPAAGVKVTITLCDLDGNEVEGHVVGAPGQFVHATTVHAGDDGTFSAELIANADVSPANTYYKVQPGRKNAPIIIEATADGTLDSLGVVSPAALGASATLNDLADVDVSVPPNDQDALVFDALLGVWVSGPPAAAAPMTGAQILTALAPVDGTGSGLDADTVDGQHASAFQPADGDLTLIAALVTDPFGRSILTLATAAALRALAGLGTTSTLNLDTDGGLTANSDALVPSQKAVKTYADALIAAADAMVFKGVIDCSASPNYPAADRGHTYKVSVAGKVGGASGVTVEVGDTLMCITDGSASGTQAAVGANWDVVQANLDGAVIGPASSTDQHVAIFSGATGKLLADSGVVLGNAASKNVGTTAGTVAAGDDSRLVAATLTRTAVKTTNYSAAANELVPVDTTAGSVTVTFPTAPANGTRIGVKQVVRGGTNVVNLALGGSDVFNVAGGSAAGSLKILNQSIVAQYDSSTAIWTVTAADLPLSGLDARHPLGWGFQIVPADTVLTTGGGSSTAPKGNRLFRVPTALNGAVIGVPEGSVSVVSSSAIPTFQLHRFRLGGAQVDVLSTLLTIDVGELDSSTAAVAAVVNATNATMATGDLLYWECTIAGTGTKGGNLWVPFTYP